MSAERQTGQTPQMLLDAPSLPRGLEQLWSDFLELHTCRGSSGFGPSRITFTDLDAWQRVNATRLAPWQVQAIMGADSAFMAEQATRQASDA